MSQWITYRHMAVDPSAFCAFGIQRRKEVAVVLYDLWGIPYGGSKSVLATYDSMEQAMKEFDRLVKMATGGD